MDLTSELRRIQQEKHQRGVDQANNEENKGNTKNDIDVEMGNNESIKSNTNESNNNDMDIDQSANNNNNSDNDDNNNNNDINNDEKNNNNNTNWDELYAQQLQREFDHEMEQNQYNEQQNQSQYQQQQQQQHQNQRQSNEQNNLQNVPFPQLPNNFNTFSFTSNNMNGIPNGTSSTSTFSFTMNDNGRTQTFNYSSNGNGNGNNPNTNPMMNGFDWSNFMRHRMNRNNFFDDNENSFGNGFGMGLGNILGPMGMTMRLPNMRSGVNFVDIDNMDHDQLLRMFPVVQNGATNDEINNNTITGKYKKKEEKKEEIKSKSKSTDNKSKKEEIKEDENCSICLESFKENDEIRRLPCLHIFHKDEIDKWLKTKDACPICRTSIVNNNN